MLTGANPVVICVGEIAGETLNMVLSGTANGS
jgi:hypothetical protein